VGIGANCTIQSDLKIGANVLIADAVAFLHRREHNWDLVGLTIWDSGRGDSGGIVIEDDVWVGHGAILLGPINIGRGSIIGAGSVVTKDVVSYSIVAGVPAKLVKMRFSKEEIRVHENKIYNPSCLKRFM
jgi:acetyltransferase-like isoleucine patch superfamily enzyme